MTLLITRSRRSILCTLFLTLAIIEGGLTPTSFGYEDLSAAEPSIVLSQPLSVRWKLLSESMLSLTPATSGEHIFVPQSGGNLVALDAETGHLIWKADLGGELSAAPAADPHTVFASSSIVQGQGQGTHSLGSLYAIGVEGGVTLWSRPLPSPVLGQIALDQDNLYAGTSDGTLYALKKLGGEIAWTLRHTATFSSRPVVIGEVLYVGSDDGSLFAVDRKTGKIVWQFQSHGAIHGGVIVDRGSVFFGSADGHAYAIREDTGRLRWLARTGGAIQAVGRADDYLLVPSFDNFVYAFSLSSGRRRWKRQLAGRVIAEPLTGKDGVLFAPLSGDSAIVLSKKTGKVLNSVAVGDDNNSGAGPIVVKNTIVLSTRRGVLAFARR